MSDIENIMKMAFCTEDVAKTAFEKCGNTVDAVCMILDFKPILAPKKKELNEEQQMFKEMRVNMEKMDKNIVEGFKMKDQPVSSCLSLQDTHTLQPQSDQHSDHTQQSRQEVQVATA